MLPSPLKANNVIIFGPTSCFKKVCPGKTHAQLLLKKNTLMFKIKKKF